jgi:hypothetical protein
LAELLYKEAIKRIGGSALNLSYIILKKPALDKNGVTTILQRKSDGKELTIHIGNKNLMKNN